MNVNVILFVFFNKKNIILPHGTSNLINQWKKRKKFFIYHCSKWTGHGVYIYIYIRQTRIAAVTLGLIIEENWCFSVPSSKPRASRFRKISLGKKFGSRRVSCSWMILITSVRDTSRTEFATYSHTNTFQTIMTWALKIVQFCSAILFIYKSS